VPWADSCKHCNSFVSPKLPVILRFWSAACRVVLLLSLRYLFRHCLSSIRQLAHTYVGFFMSSKSFSQEKERYQLFSHKLFSHYELMIVGVFSEAESCRRLITTSDCKYRSSLAPSRFRNCSVRSQIDMVLLLRQGKVQGKARQHFLPPHLFNCLMCTTDHSTLGMRGIVPLFTHTLFLGLLAK
jgi:hypothetical protein